MMSDGTKQSIRERLEAAFDLTDTREGGDLDKYLELLFYDHADMEKWKFLEKLVRVLQDDKDNAMARQERGYKDKNARLEWMSEGEVQALATILQQLGRLTEAIENRLNNQWLAADRLASQREAVARSTSGKKKTAKSGRYGGV